MSGKATTTAKEASPGDMVTVSYVIVKGAQTIQASDRVDITLGNSELWPWLDRALLGMRPGETKTDLKGTGNVVGFPRNTEFGATVTLIAIHPESYDPCGWTMPTDLCVRTTEGLKKEGNELVGEGNFEAALARYTRALKCARRAVKEGRDPGDAVVKACRLNSALCMLELKQYRKAARQCDKVLQKDAMNVKALYRRGLAKYLLDDWDSASSDFKAVLSKDAENSEARNKLDEIAAKQSAQNAKEKKAFANMFGK